MPEDADERLGAVSSDALAVGLAYVLSFLYPLVSLPLLSKAFGPDTFGRLVFSLAVLQIVVYVVDYGFNISAMRRIALAQDAESRGQIVINTWAARTLLLLVSTLALAAAVWSLPLLRADWKLYGIGLICVGLSIMYPDWLLQGLGWVKRFSLIIALSRLIALCGLILTVEDASDINLALFWQFAPFLIGTILAWPMLFRRKVVKLVAPSLSEVRFAFEDGRMLFVSNLALLGTGAANAAVLGFVSTAAQVAFFGAAERFSNAGRGVMNGVQNAMLPRLARRGTGDGAARMRKVVGAGVAGLYSLGGLSLIFVAPWLIPVYLGPEFQQSIVVTQILGGGLCVAGGTAVFVLFAQSTHRFETVARITACAAIVHVCSLLILGWRWGAVGAAWAILITEIVLLSSFFLDYRRLTLSDKK